MEVDAKWYFISIAVIFGLGMAATAYSEHEEAACKVAAIEAKIPIDHIEKLCK